MTLHIKNMVCPRCIRVVREELLQLGLEVGTVSLGEAEVKAPKGQMLDVHLIGNTLQENGFELVKDRNTQLVEDVKRTIIDIVHHAKQFNLSVKNSDYIAEKVGLSYSSLSRLFSKQEGLTIEKYIILQKIEKVKELLEYEELTLSQIADKLGYSSVQHLSNQFRKEVGMSVSAYKESPESLRKSISDV
ncbi:MAG: AraC family transcriptional regulator [Chitinophagales bacterium]